MVLPAAKVSGSTWAWCWLVLLVNGSELICTRPGGGPTVPVANQPTTSKTTWVLPALLKTLTFPPAPTLATTRLGTSWPATKLRLEAVGLVSPEGKTVRNPADVGSV